VLTQEVYSGLVRTRIGIVGRTRHGQVSLVDGLRLRQDRAHENQSMMKQFLNGFEQLYLDHR
jgi:hypothetical protein